MGTDTGQALVRRVNAVMRGHAGSRALRRRLSGNGMLNADSAMSYPTFVLPSNCASLVGIIWQIEKVRDLSGLCHNYFYVVPCLHEDLSIPNLFNVQGKTGKHQSFESVQS